MYTRKICKAVGNHIMGVGPSGTFASLGEMKGPSDNPSVIKEENEVPSGAFAQGQQIAVLRKFENI